MDTINKLEVKVASWYKGAPHLPEQGQKWLATNIWWITLVGVILGSLGILSILAATFFAGAALSVYGGVAGAAVGGLVLVAALVVVVFMAVTVVLSAMAIMPLKTMQKKGWKLLFIVALVQVIEHAVSFLFNWSLFGLVWNLLFTAVGAYFLFEIRDFYGKTVTKAHKEPAQVAVSKPEDK